MEPLIITAAVTGGEHGREATPFLPITPEEIAESAYEAYCAGAAVAHIHVRDEDGVPCQDLERYAEVMHYLAERCDMVVNLTTDPGGSVRHDERLAGLQLAPELATFDAGTMSWGERVMIGSDAFLTRLADEMRRVQTRPELEIFHDGMIETCLRLAESGALEPPLYFQFVLGVPGGGPGTVGELVHLARLIPSGCTWSATGIGKASLPILLAAIAMGGHVRVGLEDQIYYSRGELAKSNAQLVSRVVRVAQEAGRPVASSGEARRVLGLKGHDETRWRSFVPRPEGVAAHRTDASTKLSSASGESPA